jgi:hypothetical protein
MDVEELNLKMNIGIWIFAIAILFGILYAIVPSHLKRRWRNQFYLTRVQWSERFQEFQDNQKCAPIYRQIVTIVRDPEIADRLIEAARKKYPYKSKSWYLEKVLYDVQRDK